MIGLVRYGMVSKEGKGVGFLRGERAEGRERGLNVKGVVMLNDRVPSLLDSISSFV